MSRSRATAPLPDATARRRAQEDFARPLVVEAGAGTGKTTTLVARILAWCLGPGWERAAAQLAEAGDAERGRSGNGDEAEEIAVEVLSRVVAVTFTEAAAGEMAERLARELARLAAGGDPPGWLVLPAHVTHGAGATPPTPSAAEVTRAPAGQLSLFLHEDPLRLRAGALLARLERLLVTTLHGWCLRLLATDPLAARLHPRPVVDADGSRTEAVVREVMEAHLEDAFGSDPDPDLVALTAAGHGPEEIAQALVELALAWVGAGDAFAADPLAPGAVSRLARRTAEACEELAGLVVPRLEDKRQQVSREVAEGLEAAVGSLGGDAPPASVEEIQAAVEPLLPRLDRIKKWRRQGWDTKGEASAFADVLPEVRRAAARLCRLLDHLKRIDPERLARGHRVAGPLLDRVHAELVRRGILPFQALLVEAARLVAEPAVAARVRRGTDQLLLDEFQDTDPLQYEIVRRIALEGPPEERPALFLVGDPKQSIYGWRNADLAAYGAFLDEVRAAGGEAVALTANFRSVSPILDEVDRAVAPVMVEAEGLQPRFERLEATAERAGAAGFEQGGRRAVEHWLSWPGAGEAGGSEDGDSASVAKAPAADTYELEAAAIARDLSELAALGVPLRETAVLLRSAGGLDVYLDALRRAGIPYRVGRETQYFRRREVIDAAALVRAVLDPGDHLALVALLRSPLVGVPDAAWLPLWTRSFIDPVTRLPGRTEEETATLLARLEAAVGRAAAETPHVPGIERLAGWDEALLAALERLAALRRAFAEEPADVFVARLRDLFVPEAVEAARHLGHYRLANLERFFRQLLERLEEGGGGDVPGLLSFLRRSVTRATEAPEGRPAEGAEDAVRVLTMHAAKGLEFDHVYLPQLHRKPGGGRDSRSEAVRLEDGWELQLLGTPSLGFDRVEARREEVEQAERVRLLYVATTRARERLVTLAQWPAEEPTAEAIGAGDASTFLELLAHRAHGLEPGLAELARRAEAGPAGRAAETDGAGRGSAGSGGVSAVDRWGVVWRLPPADPEPHREPEPLPPAAADPHAEAERMIALRRDAARRMERPLGAAASAEAHALLEPLLRGEEVPADGSPARRAERRIALAAGSAVHLAFERIDLETLAAEPAAAVADVRGSLAELVRRVEPELEPAEAKTAVSRAGSLLDRFAAGPLLPRLARIAAVPGAVLGRELPVLLPAAAVGEEAGPPPSPPGVLLPAPPVGFVAGAVDLLYRDPETGRPVVADYKTDRLAGPADRDARSAAYTRQGALYTRAVREALGLDAEPRFELWYLETGEVVEVPVDDTVAP